MNLKEAKYNFYLQDKLNQEKRHRKMSWLKVKDKNLSFSLKFSISLADMQRIRGKRSSVGLGMV